MEYTVSLASVLQDASQHFARSRGAGTAKALLREYGACFLWGIATVLLAVHRFAVAASLRIRTASLPLEQSSSPRRYCSTFKRVRRGSDTVEGAGGSLT